MDSEVIIKTTPSRLTIPRYATNTIKAYASYAYLFLDHMKKYHTLNDIRISEIEAFINTIALQDQISTSYQRALE